ncbi:hypothetical protein J8I87_12255 [Paraburkholderia sp. LEh10]|uniref:hypothetical protein n=1 Tax=Paraburkholderia sp. LEh10 TaxID=2821353 RepID=UPI001AEB59CE|nr:hypothetical protein [Paraburkholderia sp. LEh10]MBP0590475.1 hypothetical protein [Paraburkholderia sp. LEh10]
MATPAEAATSVNWVTVVASSALVSAIVNVGWNALSKAMDRRRENVKERQRVEHVKLEIVHQLEAFVRRCRNHSNDIHDGLNDYYHHHDDAFQRVGTIAFVFDPAPKWEELPVSFVAPIKVMPNQFADCDMWIRGMAEYSGIDDAYQFELERVAVYGLKALRTATAIKREINATYDGGAELEMAERAFMELIEKRGQSFANVGGSMTLIPELEAMFKAEILDMNA